MIANAYYPIGVKNQANKLQYVYLSEIKFTNPNILKYDTIKESAIYENYNIIIITYFNKNNYFDFPVEMDEIIIKCENAHKNLIDVKLSWHHGDCVKIQDKDGFCFNIYHATYKYKQIINITNDEKTIQGIIE